MQQLSSSVTPFTKYGIPAAFFVTLPAWIALAFNNREWTWVPLVWTGVAILLLLWSLPIRKVSLNGDHFIIADCGREITVPVGHLKMIRTQRWNRTPNMTLIFDPPTAFGRKIRIVTPLEAFSRSRFDRVAKKLRDIAAKNA